MVRDVVGHGAEQQSRPEREDLTQHARRRRRLNLGMAFDRRIYLDPNLVARRASKYPLIRDLLGSRVEEVISGKNRRADGATMLLRLLERTGENSAAMLQLFSDGITHFDVLDLPGWQQWRGSLAGLDRTALLSRYFELLTAAWFGAAGFEVREFEPAGAPGKRADLLVEVGGGELLVEATSPGPHQSDWIDDAMSHLVLALSRVESSLVIEVDGYESLTLTPGEGWSLKPQIGTDAREALVTQFAKAAENVDLSQLPQSVITPTDGQPVTITARKHDPEINGTVVIAGWSPSPSVPNVKRLAEKILHERKHLPDSPPSLILVDLSRWQAFRNADYSMRQVAEEIAGRTKQTVFVGSCVGTFDPPNHRLLERGVVASDPAWEQSTSGCKFSSTWGGIRFDA